MKMIKITKNIVFILSLMIYLFLMFKGRNQYIYEMSYLKCIIYILLMCLMIYIYGIIRNNEKTYRININIYIILYFLLLVCITFFIGRPKIHFTDWNFWISRPFYTIKRQLAYGSKHSILKNLIGNSIMLIPLSFLLMIKNVKYKNIFRQSLVILPVTIFIELFQGLSGVGSFDYDDIILNYVFTIIFTFIITRFSLIDRIKKLFYKDWIRNKMIKMIAFSLTNIILGVYIILIIMKII